MSGIKSDLAGNFNVPSQTSSHRIDARGDYEVPGSARRIERSRSIGASEIQSGSLPSHVTRSYNRKAAVNLDSREREREGGGSRRVIKAQTSLIPGSCAKGRRRGRAVGNAGGKREENEEERPALLRGHFARRRLHLFFRYDRSSLSTSFSLSSRIRIESFVNRLKKLNANRITWPLVIRLKKKSDATINHHLESWTRVCLSTSSNFCELSNLSAKLLHARYTG